MSHAWTSHVRRRRERSTSGQHRPKHTVWILRHDRRPHKHYEQHLCFLWADFGVGFRPGGGVRGAYSGMNMVGTKLSRYHLKGLQCSRFLSSLRSVRLPNGGILAATQRRRRRVVVVVVVVVG